MKTSLDVLNYIGGGLYSVVWIPQIYHIIKDRSVKDLSIFTLSLALVSSIFYVSWSFYNDILPSYIMGLLNLALTSVFIIIKIILDVILPLCKKESINIRSLA